MGGFLLQRPRPGAEARIECDWCFAGIANRPLDLLEIACGEVVPLLQIDPPGRSFAGGVRRYRVELGRKPRDEIGELALAAADLFQLLDQRRALAIGLFEEPAKGESHAAPIIG